MCESVCLCVCVGQMQGVREEGKMMCVGMCVCVCMCVCVSVWGKGNESVRTPPQSVRMAVCVCEEGKMMCVCASVCLNQ